LPKIWVWLNFGLFFSQTHLVTLSAGRELLPACRICTLLSGDYTIAEIL
jgi:hypothetical protein